MDTHARAVPLHSMPKKSALIFSLAAAAVIGGLAYWASLRDETAAPTPSANAQAKNTNTIADEWQWQNFANTTPAPNARENSEADEPRPTDEVPSSVVGIYSVLQSIK